METKYVDSIPKTYKYDPLKLFKNLYLAKTEKDVIDVIKSHPDIFRQENWYPLGRNENNFGVIENQQSSPIASIIEKITNSIDAILMKKSYELGISPKSNEAPKSMEEAVMKFFPDHKNWDLQPSRRKQAEEIQIIADGPPRNTSVIIYDNGEGQHPDDFESTFLSLLRGNKNEIPFVQGKYNMGGTGAIVFCGKKRYQLIASKKCDDTGYFGFTLIREHPLTKEEELTRKNTWYEYLKIDGKIPCFDIDEIDLNLYGRKFKTGTVIKLYSYQFPPGYAGFAQDLNQSINEYLFEPALPILTVDRKERYPNNKVLDLDLFGLKRRLENDQYVDERFSNAFQDELFGKMHTTCYVFKARLDGKEVKKSKEIIQRRFFKNNMSVIFSINGQVHGHYTSEFITRSLKMNLLKNHLLIHVDCTNMNYNFRKELFMASRDRLKGGDETNALRQFLAKKLGAKNSRLSEIIKRRKDSISVDSGDTRELLRNFTKSMPKDSELLRLLDDTFKLDLKDNSKKQKSDSRTKKPKEDRKPFKPKRFPSFFKLVPKNDGKHEVARIPLGGERVIKFETDVENEYFDRVEEPGKLKIGLLNYSPNNADGGDRAGKPDKIEDLLNIETSSPKDGIIKISLNPKNEVNIGDAIQMRVTLNGTGEEFHEIFWVKISEEKKTNEKVKKEKKENIPDIGLPDFVEVVQENKEERENVVTWEQVEESTGEKMDFLTVMYPLVSGEKLEKIYINMDSKVLKNFKAKYKNINEKQIESADIKYISSVYFHTLFLYTISKKRRYRIYQESNNEENYIDLGTYIRDLFDNYYSEFILNFRIDDLMAILEE